MPLSKMNTHMLTKAGVSDLSPMQCDAMLAHAFTGWEMMPKMQSAKKLSSPKGKEEIALSDDYLGGKGTVPDPSSLMTASS